MPHLYEPIERSDVGTIAINGTLNAAPRDWNARGLVSAEDLSSLAIDPKRPRRRPPFPESRRTVERWFTLFSQRRNIIPRSFIDKIPAYDLAGEDFDRWFLAAGLTEEGVNRDETEGGRPAIYDLNLSGATLGTAYVAAMDVLQGAGADPRDPRNSGAYLSVTWHTILIYAKPDDNDEPEWSVEIHYNSGAYPDFNNMVRIND